MPSVCAFPHPLDCERTDNQDTLLLVRAVLQHINEAIEREDLVFSLCSLTLIGLSSYTTQGINLMLTPQEKADYEPVIETISRDVYEFVLAQSPVLFAKKPQCSGRYQQIILHGNLPSVTRVMAAYQYKMQNTIAATKPGMDSRASSVEVLQNANAAIKKKCELTLYHLLLSKLMPVQAEGLENHRLVELELARSFRWLMRDYKVRLTPLNRLLKQQLPKIEQKLKLLKALQAAPLSPITQVECLTLINAAIENSQWYHQLPCAAMCTQAISRKLAIVKENWQQKSDIWSRHAQHIEHQALLDDLFE